jgi:hypothetical protein
MCIQYTNIYICAIEYYSAIKKTEVMSFGGKWMEIIMLSKRDQAQKAKYHLFSLICGN